MILLNHPRERVEMKITAKELYNKLREENLENSPLNIFNPECGSNVAIESINIVNKS